MQLVIELARELGPDVRVNGVRLPPVHCTVIVAVRGVVVTFWMYVTLGGTRCRADKSGHAPERDIHLDRGRIRMWLVRVDRDKLSRIDTAVRGTLV